MTFFSGLDIRGSIKSIILDGFNSFFTRLFDRTCMCQNIKGSISQSHLSTESIAVANQMLTSQNTMPRVPVVTSSLVTFDKQTIIIVKYRLLKGIGYL